jgi:hypothetical protein
MTVSQRTDAILAANPNIDLGSAIALAVGQASQPSQQLYREHFTPGTRVTTIERITS